MILAGSVREFWRRRQWLFGVLEETESHHLYLAFFLLTPRVSEYVRWLERWSQVCSVGNRKRHSGVACGKQEQIPSKDAALYTTEIVAAFYLGAQELCVKTKH